MLCLDFHKLSEVKKALSSVVALTFQEVQVLIPHIPWPFDIVLGKNSLNPYWDKRKTAAIGLGLTFQNTVWNSLIPYSATYQTKQSQSMFDSK